MSGLRTNFTQGGVCHFALDRYGDKDEINAMEKIICADRQGFYGWFGFGGSILQVGIAKKYNKCAQKIFR